MVLEVKGLRKSYAGTEVLKGIDLTVGSGETVVIMGPSGCGKSTLLRCINRLTEPDAGEVYFNGIPLMTLSENDLRMVRRKIGFVFQGHNLVERMNVIENVALGLVISGAEYAYAHKQAMMALEKVGLADKPNAYPNELSGGERQRVGIARALVMEPDIILWDEPTASLDPMLVGQVYKLIEDLAASEGTAMLIITHEVLFALRVANRLVLMDNGRVVEEGIPSEVLSKPTSQLGYTLSDAVRSQESHRYVFRMKKRLTNVRKNSPKDMVYVSARSVSS